MNPTISPTTPYIVGPGQSIQFTTDSANPIWSVKGVGSINSFGLYVPAFPSDGDEREPIPARPVGYLVATDTVIITDSVTHLSTWTNVNITFGAPLTLTPSVDNLTEGSSVIITSNLTSTDQQNAAIWTSTSGTLTPGGQTAIFVMGTESSIISISYAGQTAFADINFSTGSSGGGTGPKGDKGDTGSTGATGPKGDAGDAGATGPKGDKGDTGDTGAQGPNGFTGPKGDKGDTGDSGGSGSAVTIRHIFLIASTWNYVHNLGTLNPIMSFIVYSGSSNYDAVVFDANTVSITASGPLDLACNFLPGGTLVFDPVQDFTPTLGESSFSVPAGKSHHVTLTQVASVSGSGIVTYTCTNAPSGITLSFGTNPLNGTPNSTLTCDIGILIDVSVATGLNTLTFSGTNGLVTHTVNYALTVLAAGTETIRYTSSPIFDLNGNDSGPPNTSNHVIDAQTGWDVQFSAFTNAQGGDDFRHQTLFSMRSGSTTVLSLVYANDSVNHNLNLGSTTLVQNPLGGFLTDGSGAYTVIRIKFLIDSTFGSIQLSVNGTVVFTQTNFDSTQAGSFTTIDNFMWFSPTPFFTNGFQAITIWDF